MAKAIDLYDVGAEMANRAMRARPTPVWFGAAHCTEREFAPYRHLRFIGAAIARTVAKGNGRLIVNIPPQFGKTFLVSQLTPAWCLETWPNSRVIVTAYSDELSDMSGRWVRNLFEKSGSLRTKLRPDSTAADRWNTDEGGGMKTAGVGGTITGFGGNLVVVDDPYKDVQDAYSPTYNRHLQEWWRGVLENRLAAGGSIIVCHHRWHQDDLTGWLLEKSEQKWEHIRLPNIAEKNDVLGRREGQVLCPAMHPREQVYGFRRSQGEFFDALHQQSPRLVGTGAVYHRFGAWNLDQGIAPRPDLPLAWDLDFNINPGMHAEIAQYDPRLDLFTFLHEFHGPRMSLSECIMQFEAWIRARGGFKWPELHVFGDASGNQANATVGESCYDLLRSRLGRLGIVVRYKVPKANPPVIERLATFNDALKDMDDRVHVKIHPACVRLLADMKNLRSNEAGTTEKHVQALSHASEAAGYMVHVLRPVGGPIQIPRGRFSVNVN